MTSTTSNPSTETEGAIDLAPVRQYLMDLQDRIAEGIQAHEPDA